MVKFLQHIEEKFNSELALSVRADAVNSQAEASLFCAFNLKLNPEQIKKIRGLLQQFESFELLSCITFEHSCPAQIFLYELAIILKKESVRQEYPLCDPTCKCCKGVNERMHSRARSIANARISRFLENLTSSESVEFLEKYGEIALKSVCDRIMY